MRFLGDGWLVDRALHMSIPSITSRVLGSPPIEYLEINVDMNRQLYLLLCSMRFLGDGWLLDRALHMSIPYL
jgi:hypothetical protein